MSHPLPHDSDFHQTRRQFFGRSALGLGTAALAHLLPNELRASSGTLDGGIHHPAKAS
jgi:hypothetical protein